MRLWVTRVVHAVRLPTRELDSWSMPRTFCGISCNSRECAHWLKTNRWDGPIGAPVMVYGDCVGRAGCGKKSVDHGELPVGRYSIPGPTALKAPGRVYSCTRSWSSLVIGREETTDAYSKKLSRGWPPYLGAGWYPRRNGAVVNKPYQRSPVVNNPSRCYLTNINQCLFPS